MKIVRKTNGNVVLTSNSGVILKRFEPTAHVQWMSSDIIEIHSGGIIKLLASEIIASQLEPAGEIAFNGDAADLIDLLTSDFFTTTTESVTVMLDGASLSALESITVQNGSGVNAVNIQDGGNSITVDAVSLPLPAGAATELTLAAINTDQTNGTQKTQITDGAGTVNTKQLGSAVTNSDIGLITNSVIHGLSSAGGGAFVDVKVAPSGSLQTAIGDISGIVGQKTMANSVPVVIASNQSAIPTTLYNPIGNFGIDAGGRTRISQITTLFDGKIIGEDDTFLFENIGSGAATYGSNKVNLSVTAGQYEIRQSKRFFPYFSGKVQLIEVTCDNFQTEANVTKRIGYFSSSPVAPYDTVLDGFFIEDNGTKKTLYAYRAGTKTIEVDFTAMDNYAIVSGYNWSNFTVMAFDFLWLGGAILRFWLKTSLGFVLVHTVNYSGSATDTFILSPNQTLRYEVRSTGGAGSLRYICSQVATEGSVNEAGKTFAILNYSACTTNAVGTVYAIKGIKKRTTFRDTPIQILQMALSITATTDSGIVLLYKNPTLSAPLSYVNNGKIQDGSPSVPGTPPTITIGTGRVLAALPISNGTQGYTDVMKENFLSFLSSTINDTMDEYILAYMPTTINQTVTGVINLKEF